mmetsp:Transcript_39995/g.73211  ORF Transcript_39995/g.73211 Transcript_39995/m.73211 type:complete len:449 (+) Transcript_39995:225-1571(+)
MTSTEDAVVTAHDWIRGITFSILASIIGGASKLSIRKSWLIDARRKQGIVTSVSEVYGEVYSPDVNNGNHGFDNEITNLVPLEVGSISPPSISNHPEESFSSEDYGGNDNDPTAIGYFFNTSVGNRNDNIKINNIFSPKQIAWLLYLSGMVGMTFLNPLCCVLAMKYANPSILAPFSGLTLVWVVLFSSMVVDEHPGKSQKVACALIVAGEVLVAMFGDHTNGEDRDVEDVLSSYDEPAFRTFIILMTLYLVQLGIFIWVCPETSLLRKVAWGSIGGSITGFQNFLKDALTIYAATIKSQNSLSSGSASPTGLPATLFLFMALAMLTAFVGLLCLAACMKRYDVTYSAAMFVVSFVISASLMSSVHYHTFDHLEGVSNYVMYPLGLMTLILGAFILVKPKAGAGGFLSEANGGEDDRDALDGDPPCMDLNVSSGARDGGYRERLLNDD